jgi:hypothetical protein
VDSSFAKLALLALALTTALSVQANYMSQEPNGSDYNYENNDPGYHSVRCYVYEGWAVADYDEWNLVSMQSGSNGPYVHTLAYGMQINYYGLDRYYALSAEDYNNGSYVVEATAYSGYEVEL